MNERARQVAVLYCEHRVKHQRSYYAATMQLNDRASGQAAWTVGALLTGASIAGGLAAADISGTRTLFGVVGAVLSALATAVAAYEALYGFERNASLYGDALRSLDVAAAELPDDGADDAAVAAWAVQVEEVLRREQSQWGQLTEEAHHKATGER